MKKLFRDTCGSAAIEAAFALPILILFIWGIFQFGVAFEANAGMQHALGEGARFATLYPQPDNAAIRSRIQSKVFGVRVGTFSTPTVTDQPCTGTTAACATYTPGYKDLSVSFTMTPNFLCFTGPPINLTKTKRVYTAGRIT